MQYGGKPAVKGMTSGPPGGRARSGAKLRRTLLCSAGGRRQGRLNEHALEAA
jgi:hypothetical protein